MKKTDNNIHNLDEMFSEYEDYNSYYGSVSVIFRILSFVLFTFLLIFIVSSAFLSAEEFSYSNLEFLVRNFALTLEENKDSTRQEIRYTPDSSNQFGLFGEGVAVCGNSGVAIYSATGRLTCSSPVQYRKPIMRSSDKYVLIFDDGGGSFSVFNSFSRVYSTDSCLPIYNAVLSDGGYFALTVASESHNSAVEIYNPSFTLINRYNTNGYVSCVDISDEEVLIVTADADSDQSDFKIEILAFSIGDNTKKFSFDCSSGFPLDCQITSYGFAVVLTDSVLFLDRSGNVFGEYVFDHSSLYDFSIGEDYLLLVFRSQGMDVSYQAICIDSLGSKIYQNDFNETIFAIDIIGSRAFILTENQLHCIDVNFNFFIDIESADYGCGILAPASEAVYFFSSAYAEYIRITGD